MRRIVVGNWKQNKTSAEVDSWFKEFSELLSENPCENVDIVIAAPFTHIARVQWLSTKLSNVHAAGQDISEFEDGRNTGRVGVNQLKDYAKYCLVGHSETGDPQELALKKNEICLSAGVNPILCFAGLENVPQDVSAILAWEDTENISTEKGGYNPKTPEDVADGVKQLRESLGEKVQIIYGGSVNRQNAQDLGNIPGLSGVLPGNASLDPHHFFEIVSAFN